MPKASSKKKSVKKKNKGGRPPKWTKPEEMEEVGEAYFAKCNKKKEPFTITGLALALNLTRQGLIEYGEKEGFSDTVKRMKTRVENEYEKRLFGPHASGPIFALKNFDWKDKQDHDHNVKMDLQNMSDEELEQRLNDIRSRTKSKD